MSLDTYDLDTLVLHGGQAPDPTTGARAVPIYQSTSFVFHDAEHARALFALDEPGNIYTRIGNPTTDVFEKRMALLEDGVGALAVASGQAAISMTIMNIAGTGDEIVSASQLYGGTYNLFAVTLPRYGITTKFVDASKPENFKAAITDKTKAIFAETVGNPSLTVLDIEKVAAIAHEAGIPLIVDNTFASPLLCRPISWGADIVVHSATKWIGGHGTSLGGVVIDGGRFNWDNPKFPMFTKPDPSYNGLKYATDFGTLAFITKLRVQLLRDFGPALSPFNSFMLMQGLETLHLRIERHNQNAAAIAAWLEAHPGVEWVSHPSLPKHPSHALAKRYLSGGWSSIVVFGIKGGREAGKTFIESLSIWSHLANVGDAKSLVIHPASTTHQQLSAEDLVKSGISEDLVRLSVGIESLRDLTADLDQAIETATGTGKSANGTKKGASAGRSINDEGVIRWALSSSMVKDEKTGENRPKVLAVVGLSSNPARPSYRVARKMQRLGYKILPVNPKETEVLGEKAIPDLSSLPVQPDILQIFRSPEAAVELAKESATLPADKKPRVFWLQEGVVSEEAANIAQAAGMWVAHNRCTYKEAQRLRGTIVTYACEL